MLDWTKDWLLLAELVRRPFTDKSWQTSCCSLPFPWSNWLNSTELPTTSMKQLHRLRQAYVTYISQEVTVQTEVNLCYLPMYLSHETTVQTQVVMLPTSPMKWLHILRQTCYLPLPWKWWSDYTYWGRLVTHLSHEMTAQTQVDLCYLPLLWSDCTDAGRLMLPTSPIKGPHRRLR